MNQVHCCTICKRNNVKLYRVYGSPSPRESKIYCKEHSPESKEMVPLIEDVDGTIWGYTSAPNEAIEQWRSLPD